MAVIIPALTLALTAVALIYALTRFVRGRRPLIHGPPRDSILTGNLGQLFSAAHGLEYHARFLKEYGTAFEVYGLLGEKQFFIADGPAISAILNNPDTFFETNAFRSLARLVFGTSLFAATGPDHRKLRKTLNPIFTTRHIKDLLPVFQSIVNELRSGLAADIRTRASYPYEKNAHSAEVDMHDWMSRTALDLIGVGGLGHPFRALEGTHDPYTDAARQLLPAIADIGIVTPFLHILMKLGPAALRRYMVNTISLWAVQTCKSVVDIMDSTAKHIFGRKKDTVSRVLADPDAKVEEELKDVLSLMLASNMKDSRLRDEEMIAQMSTLILAALDTTSGTLVHILQELSVHPEAQDRLRQEITEAQLAQGSEDLDFDTLDGLPYLDAIVAEVLRLHPSAAFMSRTSQAPFVLPLGTPVPSSRAADAPLVDALPLPAGTTIYLSTQGINRDPRIWGPDADVFRPDRWLNLEGEGKEADRESLRKARKQIPSLWNSILSFSAGPRGCIGFKFALVEMKVVLAAIIPSFRFKPSDTAIEWHLSITQAPHMKGPKDGTRVPGLPLVVEDIGDV